MEKNLKKEYIYVCVCICVCVYVYIYIYIYIWISLLKLTQHCKLTILQFLKNESKLYKT